MNPWTGVGPGTSVLFTSRPFAAVFLMVPERIPSFLSTSAARRNLFVVSGISRSLEVTKQSFPIWCQTIFSDRTAADSRRGARRYSHG